MVVSSKKLAERMKIKKFGLKRLTSFREIESQLGDTGSLDDANLALRFDGFLR